MQKINIEANLLNILLKNEKLWIQLKRPTLTKSASSSSSDNRVDLVAPRDDGKSPRGQD